MAGATITRPGANRKPLMAYLRVQRDAEREMLAALRASSDRINRELIRLTQQRGIGAAVRRDQLLLTQAAIQREMEALWTKLGRTVLAGKEGAAAAAIEATFPVGNLKTVMPARDVDYLLRSAQAQAQQTVQQVEARLKVSRIPLAESVYKNRQLSSGKIDEIVNAALGRGASAAELAKDVRAFVRPDVKGGVRYAAMRLGRTELNNSFHATQIQSGIDAPWVTAELWNLSGSHPRPDECNEYADEVHFTGGEAGQYRPDEVPPKPHPNCLCFLTPVTPSRRAFVDSFLAGEYDSYVDRMISSGSVVFR